MNIENLKQFNQLEINFLKILLSTYEYEEKQKNLNYFVKSINFKNYEKIFNETNNYITLLQNVTNKKRNINTLVQKIISCSDDGTMNKIKLIDEDKCRIERTLEGYNNYVIKVIETNNGELISICYDCN